jgi:hypothetical protein
MSEPHQTRPALTLIHVLWMTISGGATWLAYWSMPGFTPATRIALTAVAFVLLLVLTHLATVVVITALVIPRLEPGSRWSAEVDHYMAWVFPGQWGKPSDHAPHVRSSKERS